MERVELRTQRQWNVATSLDTLTRRRRIVRWWPVRAATGIHWHVEDGSDAATLTTGQAERLTRTMLAVDAEQLVLL